MPAANANVNPALVDFYPIDPAAPITDDQLEAVFGGDWGALVDVVRLAVQAAPVANSTQHTTQSASAGSE